MPMNHDSRMHKLLSSSALVLFVLCVGLKYACANAQNQVYAAQPKREAAFEASPGVAELFENSGLPEPPVPVGGMPSSEDNRQFSAALKLFAVRRDADDAGALTAYLSAHPASPWRVAVLTNLGLMYYHSARFSLALDAFGSAWREGKRSEGAGSGKDLVDRALGELLRMHARIGHKEELRRLLGEIKGRSLTGAATEYVAGAREGLWMMEHNPGVAYLCGPKALQSLIERFKPKDAKLGVVDAARSGPHGYSLNQVANLANQAKLPYRMVKRESGAELVMPAVVHWKSNHYAALLEAQGGRIHIKDPTFGGDLWVSRRALEEEASGYMMVPNNGKLPKGYAPVSLAEAGKVFGRGAIGQLDDKATRPYDDKVKPCQPGKGMCQYNFHTQAVSLNITDTPLGYTPPRGNPVVFTVTYNQREAGQPANFTYSNLGPKWTFNWLSYLVDDPANPSGNIDRYVAGGGTETHSGFNEATQSFTPQSASHTVLVRVSTDPPVYKLRWPDGSHDDYALPENSSMAPRRIFLTKRYDAQGNWVRLSYDSKFRLRTITDNLLQHTTLAYEDPTDIRKITKATDPFGRVAVFGYTGGLLTSITDAIGLRSQLTYGGNQFITAMATPYGTTAFASGESSDNNGPYRALQATDPQGGKERLEFRQKAPGVSFSEAQVPQGIAVFNRYLNERNSFYWDKQAMKTAPGDYTKAHITHWLHGISGSSAAPIKESEKAPLEGRVWYNYPGQIQAASANAGMTEEPSRIARVLDDGTTQLYRYEYNSLGKTTKAVDPLGRETVYEYDANGVDLLRVKQKNGAVYDLLAEITGYSSDHRPRTYKETSGAITAFTWNDAGQPLTVTNAMSQKTAFKYNASGYLLSIVNPLGRVQAGFTYDVAGRVATATDESGYLLSYGYDALDRQTRITYPDGTFRRYSYNKLDVASVTDRLGRTTFYAYDAVRQLARATDALGRVTRFTWCGCGSLASITDALGQSTAFSHDLQGRLTAKRYADGQGVDYLYENATSRIKSRIDGLNQEARYAYAKDNALLDITYVNAVNATPARHFRYAAYYPRLAAFNNGQGQTDLRYFPAGVPGSGRPAAEIYAGGEYASKYTYDSLNRAIGVETVKKLIYANGIGEASLGKSRLTYDALDRVRQEQHNSDGGQLYQTTQYSYAGDSERLTQIIHPNATLTNFSYFGATGDLRLNALSHSRMLWAGPIGSGGQTISSGIYAYDAEGRITGWRRSGVEIANETLAYDAIGQLLRVSPTAAGAAPVYAYAYDAAGNRIRETVGNRSTTAAYNNLNQLLTNGGDSYSHDLEGNQSARHSPTLGNRQYRWDAENRLIAIEDPAHPGTRSDFQYDALGRRVGIQDRSNGAIVRDLRLIYCGSALCAQEDRITGSTVFYFGDGEYRNGQARYYHRDHLGSVRAVTDANGVVKAAYGYDPYGRRTVLSGSASDSAFGYTGHYVHQATGLALAPYRAYDATIGRWISRDPIGEAGGINPYAYVGGNPVNAIDPTGEFANLLIGGLIGGGLDLIGQLIANNGNLSCVSGGGVGRAVALGAVTGGLGDLVVAIRAAKIAKETTTLYRAVGPAELADIEATSALRNLGSAEGKYFTTSPESASSYAKQAVNGFGDPPYSLIQTQVPNSIFKGLTPASVDSGIPAWVIPNERLQGLIPIVRNVMSIP